MIHPRTFHRDINFDNGEAKKKCAGRRLLKYGERGKEIWE